MSNLARVKVRIKGTRVYLYHRFPMDALDASRKPKAGTPGNDPKEWKKTVAVNWETRQLYIPYEQVFAMICAGAKYTKKGRSSIQRDVIATLQVEGPEEIYIDRYLPEEEELTQDKTQFVYLDVRSVVNPSTRGRNIRYRIAMSPGWEVGFEISFDETIVSAANMHAAIIDGGRLCGLGSGRKIGMGRFEVVSFEPVG